MATATFRCAWRPLRIGFVLRAGSIEDVVRAATICTQLWGGINNVLIPVPDDGGTDKARVLARRFCVDLLVPMGQSPGISAFVEEQSKTIPSPMLSKDFTDIS